jgi:hypothetical protein
MDDTIQRTGLSLLGLFQRSNEITRGLVDILVVAAYDDDCDPAQIKLEAIHVLSNHVRLMADVRHYIKEQGAPKS